MRTLTLVAVLLLMPLAVRGQQAAAGVGIGGSKLGDFAGFTVTGFFEASRSILFGSASAELSWGPTSDDARFYRDEFDNGQSRCRDRETGRFANDSECMETDYGGSVEAGLTLPAGESRILLGGGYRLGERAMPFGSASFRSPLGGGWIALRVAAGEGLLQGLVLFGFPVGQRVG